MGMGVRGVGRDRRGTGAGLEMQGWARRGGWLTSRWARLERVEKGGRSVERGNAEGVGRKWWWCRSRLISDNDLAGSIVGRPLKCCLSTYRS